MTRIPGLYWVVEHKPPNSTWTVAQWDEIDQHWVFIGGGIDGFAVDEQLYHIGHPVIFSEMDHRVLTVQQRDEGYIHQGKRLPWINAGRPLLGPSYTSSAVYVCRPLPKRMTY